MHVHDALPTGGFFRLFLLEPGTGKQPLRGSLSTCKLDEAPYFEAISYVWGSPDQCVELICDGQQLFITLSLSDLLYRVRLPDRPRTLWTDLICINQEDLDEKGSQVSLMGSIYRRSNRTLIHVGADDEGHGETLLGLLDHIDRNIFASLSEAWDSAPFLDKDDPLVHDARWVSLERLLATPWFLRGWVVQEAAYARDGVVLWGDHEVSWKAIMRMTMWARRRAYSTICQTFDLGVSELHMLCFSILTKVEVQPLMPEEFWRDIGKVLSTFHSGRLQQLADPRDRIYAFYDLPASNKSGKLQVIPNYHKSFSDVCKDFALNYLNVYDDLDLLLMGPYGGFLSSWADYDALIEKKHEGKLSSFRHESNNLPVSGLRFAKVQMVSADLRKEQLTLEGVASLWSEVCRAQKPEVTTDSDRFSMFLAALRSGTRSSELDDKREIQDEAAFTLEILNVVTGEAKRSIRSIPTIEQASGGDAQLYLRHMQIMADNKRLIITDRGYGIAPVLARKDDECVIIYGGKMPFLLRKADGVGNYKLIAPIYHSSKYVTRDQNTGWHVGVGLVNGKDWENWDIEEESFFLV